jgi:poly-gamma-glutamate synthesis protein (capsule biosynthesis protein)
VVSFASTQETIGYENLRRYWLGESQALVWGDTAPTLVLTENAQQVLTHLWGESAPTTPIQIVADITAVNQALWAQRPNALSMVSFSELSPDLKVLRLDNIDIFADDFSLLDYLLRVEIGIEGEEQALGHAVEDLLAAGTWQATNRSSDKMTRLVLTGVTALTRATAYKMEVNGLTYPATNIMPFIENADILHTSNEVPFSDNCPPADPFLSTTIFCADNRYIELLEFIGLDVVELTGNHINDYGPGAFRHTLDIYDKVGMGYYGGGRTPEEARAAYITEHNGNTFAFIGCNVPGPFKAWVSTERAGAAPCDEAFLAQELPRLATEVDIVVMSVQQWEFYRYQVGQEQVRQFTEYANLGADVVIGSQAHQPQGFSFIPREGQSPAFLHHGLGNLFFDQMGQINTRQMFIDKLIVYDGKIISVVLFTGIIEDFCCPRLMTDVERNEFLELIYSTSTWE